MGGDAPVEDEYLAPGQKTPQMIISAPIAEAELKDRTRHLSNQFGTQRKAVTLGAEAADKAVEPAHGPRAPPRY